VNNKLISKHSTHKHSPEGAAEWAEMQNWNYIGRMYCLWPKLHWGPPWWRNLACVLVSVVRDVNETLESETRPRRLIFSPRRDRDVKRPRPRRFSRRWHFGLP